jgi:transposase-like protein
MMSNHPIAWEIMVEKKELDAMLAELVRGQKPNEIFGEGRLVKELTKRLVEKALEAELTSHLGYEKHEERLGENARKWTWSQAAEDRRRRA